jgi:5-methylthioadenosine/S-adenosylhomocysteine deaminase
MSLCTYIARQFVVDAQQTIEGGGVVVSDEGEVLTLLESAGMVKRHAEGEVIDLGEGILAPGWVNAHSHLELSGLEGLVSPGEVFPDWIKGLLRERAGLSDADFDSAVERGAQRLLEGGTTTVGDVDSTGASVRVLAGHPLRAVVFREALDLGDNARKEEAMAALRAPLPSGAALSLGVSPHAGYTVSDALLKEISADFGDRGLPVQVHWNETTEEADWEGARPSAFDGLVMPSPERPTLERLDAAGLLRRPASLVHANFPGEGDARLLRERGVVVIHCPGAHAWFGRGDFDAEGWWAEGVDVALGTDSLAGNAALDMGREVSLFRKTHPGASPGQAFDMATRAGARALGLDGQVGGLSVGSRADFVLHQGEGEALEVLTSGMSQVQRIWVSGVEICLGEGRAL